MSDGSRRGRFRGGVFLAALAISLLFHGGYLVPQLLAPLVERPKTEELEIAYAPELGAPDEPAPVPSEETPSAAPPPVEAAPAAPEPAQLSELPSPAPTPAQPEPISPPVPLELPKERMQMVDQDRFEDEADNPEAHYLGQKNHRAAEETRAPATNLIREAEGPKASSTPSDNRDPEPGAAEERIAELQERPGPEHSMPRAPPREGEEGSRPEPPTERPNRLSMRAPGPAADAPEGEAPERDDVGPGDLDPRPRSGAGGGGPRSAARGGRVKLKLDHHDYDAIEGYASAEAERRAAGRAEVSRPKGRYDRYLAKVQSMRSALENFTPEVRPGNQSELGTRASPFAAYITAMHRQIHKIWTFGFLTDLESRSSRGGPFERLDLWTQLEIVLKGDGTVDKVSIVRTSGVLPYDVAAIDSVMSAAPFPVPPRAIKSANGKIYMDWQFHRDERACGTFGVDPHILTTPGEHHDHDSSETGAAARALAAKMAQGPRRLERGRAVEPSGGAPSTPQRAAPPGQVVVPEVTAEVRAAAEGWFAAYVRGDAAWLAGWSATPFRAAGEVIARDAEQLKEMYRQLLAEAPAARATRSMDVLTPAGIRGRLGGLPPGGQDEGMLFAVGRVGTEEFILLLRRSSQGWRVSGIAR